MKRIIIFALIFIIIFTVSGCSPSKDYIAKVNDQIISQSEFDKRLTQTATMNNFDLDNPEFAEYKEIFMAQVLDRLIEEKLLEKAAKDLDIKVSSDDVGVELNSIKEQFESQEEFKKYFEEQLNMSESDIKDNIEKQLLIQLLYEEITKDVNSVNIDLVSYYEENKEEFYQEEQIRARHILVNSKEEAEKIIKEIVEEKKDMAELAVEKSTDPTAKNNQGDLGYFGRGQMVQSFEDAAFNLKVGEVSKPVETTFGFHVIKVEDKIEAKQRTFLEIKEELEEKFLFEEKNKVFSEYLSQLKSEATIENKLEEQLQKDDKEKEENK